MALRWGLHYALSDDPEAFAGDFRYRGISTSSSVALFNRTLPKDYFLKKCVAERTNIVRIGGMCGLRNVPMRVAGPLGYLVEPDSGKIEDTEALDSARKATAEKPLVVVMGGPLTVVADAYLLDSSIVDKMIVAWTGGRYDSMAIQVTKTNQKVAVEEYRRAFANKSAWTHAR